MVDAGRVGKDDGRPIVGFGFLEGLDQLLLVVAHGNAGHIYVAVGHHHAAHVLLGDLLAGGGELGDRAGRGGLGGLAAGIRIHLGVVNDDVDVLAGSHHVVQTAEGDVIGRAVAQGDPVGFLGEMHLQIQNLLQKRVVRILGQKGLELIAELLGAIGIL